MDLLIIIKNDGPLITQANYWETEWNIRGRFLLSANAGAYRLRVPDDHFHRHPEMLEAKEAVITRGVDRLQRKEMWKSWLMTMRKIHSCWPSHLARPTSF